MNGPTVHTSGCDLKTGIRPHAQPIGRKRSKFFCVSVVCVLVCLCVCMCVCVCVHVCVVCVCVVCVCVHVGWLVVTLAQHMHFFFLPGGVTT